MSSISTGTIPVVASTSPYPWSPQILDGVTEAIVLATDEQARGRIITDLVREMYESVAWLHVDEGHDELVSLRRVLDELAAHCCRVGAGTPGELIHTSSRRPAPPTLRADVA